MSLSATELTRLIGWTEGLLDDLLGRLNSGEIQCWPPNEQPVPIVFTARELWRLTTCLAQLGCVAGEYLALAEYSPTRQELLDASTAAAQALAYAEEANERLGQIMGRLWLKPAPPAADVANDTRAEVG